MGIHNYDRKYHRALELLQEENISKRNKKLILDMVNDLILENLSKSRLLKYLDTLELIAVGIGKDLDQATIEDVKTFIGKIQQKDYSVWTKESYKVIIRRFYQWLHGMKGKEYPEIVKWVNIHISRAEKKLPSDEELLIEEDIIKVMSVLHHPRDKALLSLLWETGCRISELGNLKIKNVIFDKYGAMLSVHGKTGARKIRVISSTAYLSTWLNNHPQRNNKEASVWINVGNVRYNKPMAYGNIFITIRRWFTKAGINKKCNPHLFRHSRATFMAHHLTEFQMNQYFGWIQGSDMPATYVHMSGKNVDTAILKMNGIEIDTRKDEQKILPKTCPRCTTINAPDGKQCNQCGGFLDLTVALKIEEESRVRDVTRDKWDKIMNLLLQDEEARAFFAKKLESGV